MSEREKEILRTLEMALPVMSEFEKGYMLGMARASAGLKKESASNLVNEAELATVG